MLLSNLIPNLLCRGNVMRNRPGKIKNAGCRNYREKRGYELFHVEHGNPSSEEGQSRALTSLL